MAANLKLTKTKVREALEANGGLVSQAAQALECDPSNVQKWMKRHPDLRTIRNSGLERLKDAAEGKLFAAIQKGEMKWVTYFLDAHAKDRGYGLKMQVTGPGGGPVNVKLDMEALCDGLNEDQLRAALLFREAIRAAPGPGAEPGGGPGADAGVGEEGSGEGEV